MNRKQNIKDDLYYEKTENHHYHNVMKEWYHRVDEFIDYCIANNIGSYDEIDEAYNEYFGNDCPNVYWYEKEIKRRLNENC